MERAEVSHGADLIEQWDHAAAGWSRRADSIQEFGMRVSVWMVEQLDLQPGQRVLDLAAGPGDTGFLAAELVKPGGTLVSSDASEAMRGVARGRARDLGVTNVEFQRLALEWIDLPTASVDAALCRWGLMLVPDPGAALQEIRRVLRPGGKLALAVWAGPERNPWAALPRQALIELGHAAPPPPGTPTMFSLADPRRLRELIEDAGFVEVVLDAVELRRDAPSLEAFVEETLDISRGFAEVHHRLSEQQWREVIAKLERLTQPFTGEDGALHLPATSIVAAASA